jgi:hypothetical protein
MGQAKTWQIAKNANGIELLSGIVFCKQRKKM